MVAERPTTHKSDVYVVLVSNLARFSNESCLLSIAPSL